MRGYGKDPSLSLMPEAEQHIVAMIEAFYVGHTRGFVRTSCLTHCYCLLAFIKEG